MGITMQLYDLGWDLFFENNFKPFSEQGYSSMRIIRVNREKYIALGEQGEFNCEISGKFRFEIDSKGKFPTVGDWIVVSVSSNEKKGIIHALLPRKSSFSRKVAGEITCEQVVAANIDTLFIAVGLDLNFNLRRIERYLSIAWESKAMPVILLNKADICQETEARKSDVESIAPGVNVHVISAYQNIGMKIFNNYIHKGKTVAFLGSSGVGKSTIINFLLGADYLKVNEVSELGSRGRHTTTFRELIVLPEGGMVIDTPGMRELQVWGDENGLKQTFDDIEELAINCRFRDCSHINEPGCAVKEAICNDLLEQNRLDSYLKLKKEFEYLANRQTMKPSTIEKSRWKKISKYARDLKKQDKNNK